MKKAIALCVGLLALGATALGGPFFRVEQTWDTGLVIMGGLADPRLKEPIYSINAAVIEGYVGKSDPFTFSGWWTIGGGAWLMTSYFPNLSFGGGLRFLFLVENSTISDAAWCPYLEAGWWFGPFQMFVKLNWFYQFSQTKPLGAPALSFGFTVDLGVLRTGEH